MFLKRIVDLVLSAAILVLMSPVMALVSLLIFWESGRPVLFSQIRTGRGFQNFRILKFRTMIAGREGPSITIAGDRRITRVGAILRSTKLDELPQFWNVIRGEMSIVGPRPEVPEYVHLFRARYARILTVAPGITDLASIRFHDEEELLSRSDNPLAEYRDRVLPAKLDLGERYILERSTLRDLQIIVQSAFIALRPWAVFTCGVAEASEPSAPEPVPPELALSPDPTNAAAFRAVSPTLD